MSIYQPFGYMENFSISVKCCICISILHVMSRKIVLFICTLGPCLSQSCGASIICMVIAIVGANLAKGMH